MMNGQEPTRAADDAAAGELTRLRKETETQARELPPVGAG
jgi:hypothetical protein